MNIQTNNINKVWNELNNYENDPRLQTFLEIFPIIENNPRPSIELLDLINTIKEKLFDLNSNISSEDHIYDETDNDTICSYICRIIEIIQRIIPIV